MMNETRHTPSVKLSMSGSKGRATDGVAPLFLSFCGATGVLWYDLKVTFNLRTIRIDKRKD